MTTYLLPTTQSKASTRALGPSHDHVSAAYELEATCSMWVLGPSYDYVFSAYEPEAACSTWA